MRQLIHYLAALNRSRLILWCYLSWYVTMVALYFDPSPRLWLSSLGISVIIGYALLLSTGNSQPFWVAFRLFLMPFCVSSYSSLIKGHGFVLLFSPSLIDNVLCLAACAAFLTIHKLSVLVDRRQAASVTAPV